MSLDASLTRINVMQPWLGEEEVAAVAEVYDNVQDGDELAAVDVVDELCLTIVPMLTGGDAVRIATGADVDVALRPALLLEQDGTLLGRWLVER